VPTAPKPWKAQGDQFAAIFGLSVSDAGDVNGDGFEDVIVGAFAYDNGETDEGRAFVYHGSGSGLGTTPAWTAEGNKQYAQFGWSVSDGGNVNDDGFDDVIVGDPSYFISLTNDGRVFMFKGSASGVGTTLARTTQSDQAGAYFGNSVSTAGDVNGDGFDDVIVGAYFYDTDQEGAGLAALIYGRSTA
jgi:hypothetical protein